MANFFRRSSSKDTVVVRSSRHQDIVRCRKHPKHRQSPGVCSVCLREKLSQLSSSTTTTSSPSSSRENNNNNYDFSSSSSSSLSSYYSSSSASSCSSPVNARRRFCYYAEGRSINSFSSLTLFGRSKKKKKNYDSQHDQLSKSRSLIFITRNTKEGVIHGDEMKKKGGLLENFLLGRGMKIKMEENLVHSSKTTTEINVTGS